MKTPELNANFFQECRQLFFLVFFKPITLRRYIRMLTPYSGEKITIWKAIKQNTPNVNRFINVLLATTFIATSLSIFSIVLFSYGLVMQEFSLLYILMLAVMSAIGGLILSIMYNIIFFMVIGAAGDIAFGVTTTMIYSVVASVWVGWGLGVGMIASGGDLNSIDIPNEMDNLFTMSIFSGILLGLVFDVRVSVTGIVSYLLVMGIISIPGNLSYDFDAETVFYLAAGDVVNILAAVLIFNITRGIAGDLIMAFVIGIVVLIQLMFMKIYIELSILYSLVFIVSFLLGYFRVIYYWFELPFHLFLVYYSRIRPFRILSILRYSPVFWDEKIWFRLPFLDYLLRQGFKENEEEGFERIIQVAQSFRQRQTAFSALAWVISDSLKKVTDTVSLIGRVKQLEGLPEILEDFEEDTSDMFPNFQAISRGLASSPNTDIYSRRLSLRDTLNQLDILNSRVKLFGKLAIERWEPVVEQWQKVISNELIKLSDVTNKTENPYQTGNPLQLTRKVLFKGRQYLRDAVVNSLLEHNRPTFILHGPRRMGKTSFLLQLPALLPGHTIPVFIDLQRPAYMQDTNSFLFYIARTISRDSRPYRIIIPPPRKEEFTDYPFKAFETWLEAICLPFLKNFNILLTFDEFEKLGEAIQKGKIDHEILDELRHLIQHQSQMAFLFAGVRTMEDFGPDWSSYFINIKPIQISYLLPEEGRSLITDPDPEANFTLKYDEEVVNQIVEMTCCHPFLVQVVCSAIVEEANAAKINHVDLPLLEKAVIRALQQGEPYFRNIWDEMAGQNGQAVLRRIAMSEESLDLHETDSNIQKALVRMVKLKVLTKNDNGTYKVEVPLVKRWILELSPISY
ncbi:hypothetical protein QUF90_01750 [Desulfococcaceae bacterium HSG9]|nr:hypothetical protein [Desulfococcaceae bacterium HSG9]